jgi:hypothetical protein
MGHIFSKEGVKVDPTKIEAIKNWPKPKTLKSLHKFLGLIGYHHKLVKDYSKNRAHLIAILK